MDLDAMAMAKRFFTEHGLAPESSQQTHLEALLRRVRAATLREAATEVLDGTESGEFYADKILALDADKEGGEGGD